MSPTRRDFLEAAAAAAAAGLTVPAIASAIEPAARAARNPPRPFAGLPVVISSPNAFRTMHADGRPAIQVAYDMIAKGADPLDAAVAGVQLVELDPTDHSVGLHGYPNEEGVVQLDASCMHGPTKRAAAVASLEDIATPAAVAKMVMDRTDHVLLVGPGAKKFALATGFKEDKYVDPEAHAAWLRWKTRLNPNDAWLDLPPGYTPPPAPPTTRPPDDDLLHIYYDEYGVPFTYGTINMNAIDAKGDVGSVTTTSGKPFFELQFYAVNKKGEYAGASCYEGSKIAVCDSRGPRVEDCASLFKGRQPIKTASDSAYVKP